MHVIVRIYKYEYIIAFRFLKQFQKIKNHMKISLIYFPIKQVEDLKVVELKHFIKQIKIAYI